MGGYTPFYPPTDFGKISRLRYPFLSYEKCAIPADTHPVLGKKRADFGFEPGFTAGFRSISTQFG